MKHLPAYHITSLILLGLLAACDSQDKAFDAQSNMQQAAQFKQSGEMERAAQLYGQIAANPQTPAHIAMDAKIELAAADRKLGRAQEAVAVMQELAKQEPENQMVLSQLGYALIDADHPEDAVAVFDHLITLSPDSASAYNGKGVAFDKAGNHLAAEDLYMRALKLSPDSLSIQNNMAMSLILNNQLDPAIAILEKLRLQNGSNKTVLQNLALAYGLKGDKDKALALNMKDLSQDEAKENLQFYEKYSHERRTLDPSDALAHVQIGFTETPPDEIVAEPQPEPKKKVKHAAKKTKPAPLEAIAPTPAPAAVPEPEKKEEAPSAEEPAKAPEPVASEPEKKEESPAPAEPEKPSADESPAPEPVAEEPEKTVESPAPEPEKSEPAASDSDHNSGSSDAESFSPGTQLPTGDSDAPPSEFPSDKRR